MSQFFTPGGQSIGVSASASVLPMNIQGLFPWGLTGLISLQSKGNSRVFSNTTIQKQSILWHSDFFIVKLSHPYMTTGKTVALTTRTCVRKVISLFFFFLICCLCWSQLFFQWANIFWFHGCCHHLQWFCSLKKIKSEEELRWWRNRMGRPLSPLKIHRKNIWTLSKLHKTTDC